VRLLPLDPGPRARLAWHLATYVEPKVRNPKRAVELAQQAVQMRPQEGTCQADSSIPRDFTSPTASL
jgi:hypothetical protein